MTSPLIHRLALLHLFLLENLPGSYDAGRVNTQSWYVTGYHTVHT